MLKNLDYSISFGPSLNHHISYNIIEQFHGRKLGKKLWRFRGRSRLERGQALWAQCPLLGKPSCSWSSGILASRLTAHSSSAEQLDLSAKSVFGVVGGKRLSAFTCLLDLMYPETALWWRDLHCHCLRWSLDSSVQGRPAMPSLASWSINLLSSIMWKYKSIKANLGHFPVTICRWLTGMWPPTLWFMETLSAGFKRYCIV